MSRTQVKNVSFIFNFETLMTVAGQLPSSDSQRVLSFTQEGVFYGDTEHVRADFTDFSSAAMHRHVSEASV